MLSAYWRMYATASKIPHPACQYSVLESSLQAAPVPDVYLLARPLAAQFKSQLPFRDAPDCWAPREMQWGQEFQFKRGEILGLGDMFRL